MKNLAIKISIFAAIILVGEFYLQAYWDYEDNNDCLGWVCHKVQCPKDYAVYIPERQAFLPCKSFEQYIETRDVGLLR